MRGIKRYIISIVAAFGLLALPLASASAAGYNPFGSACNGNSQAAVCSNKTTGNPLTGPNGLIGKVTRVIALFAGIAAVIIIMVGGFMYITSAGDSGKVSRAKDTIIYASVGLVVIALSQGIIVFVVNRL